MLPEIVDFVKVKRWTPKIKKPQACFLYDFDSMGITFKQFVDIIAGREAILFEKPFREKVNGLLCPWCEYKAKKTVYRGIRLSDHIFSHPGKNLVSYQLVKFQKELYSLRLQFVRQGYHEALAFFVEHSCQDCPTPIVKGREGMCALPLTTRSRMRSLKVLGYPIKHLVEHPKRKYEWSALGLIVLLKNEFSKEVSIQKAV